MEAEEPASRRDAARRRSSAPAADGDAIERAGALLRERRAAGDHGRHEPLLGPRRAGAARARARRSGSRCSSTGSRAAACPPTTSCSSRARARRGAEGRRRRARDRRADGLPARLRRRRSARRPRSSSIDVAEPRARASARGRGRALRRRSARRSTRCARAPAGASRRPRAWVDAAARGRDREARGRGRPSSSDDRAPLHPMRIYAELGEVLDRDAIVIGDGGDFVSYAGRVDRHLRARLLARPGPVRLPGHRAPATRWRRSSRSPDRQVVLLLGDGAFGFSRHGVRHARAPRRERRRRDGQQRHLGAREAPDGVPLRLLGRRRPAARRRATTRSSRRSAATASSSSGPASCGRRSSARSPRASRRW